MKIGLFYGSTTGNTEYAADFIAKTFGDGLLAESIDRVTIKDIESCDVLIFGISTWNIGELEMTWEDFFPKLDQINFTGKKIALFGMGDQVSYADTYLDAMGILYDKVVEKGAEVIGAWPTEGYDYTESLAVKNNTFVGLALDQDSQPEKTEPRIEEWVQELKKILEIKTIEVQN